MTLARRLVLVAIAVALAAACTGCERTARITYIPEGGSYEVADLDAVLADADLSRAEKVAADDVLTARQEALADLRTYGEDASRLADTLTSEFPVDVAAIPVVIERCAYQGRAAWIVIEAWAEPGAPLTYRRLWVFSQDTYRVIAATSLR